MTAILQSLDSSAEQCLQTLEQAESTENTASNDNSTDTCQDFLAAVDGDAVASYLDHCRQLRLWRTEFAAQARNNGTMQNSADALQQLIDVEYFCGDGAFKARTDYVELAFQRLQTNGQQRDDNRSAGYSQQQGQPQVSQQHQQQLQRLSSETSRQQQQQELELLRQRMERRLDF